MLIINDDLINQDNEKAIDTSHEGMTYLEDEDIPLSEPTIDTESTTEVISEVTNFTAVSYRKLGLSLLRAALPFCGSRLAVSVQGLGYAYLMGQFGASAVASGPLISGLQNAVVTPLRAGLGAINVLVPGMTAQKRVRRLVQQAYLSTLVLSVPTWAILLNARRLLAAMGTDKNVAIQVQQYMNGYAWGILPIYSLVIDQQLSLAIGQGAVATMIGLVYASLVLILGYLFTYHSSSLLYQNTYGLGLGFAVSAWFVSLALKVLFALHPAYQQYDFFHMRGIFKYIKDNMSHMLKISVPLWLQSLSESFNLMVISILMSRISNDALMAEQVSLQWMTAFSPVILAIANVTCSMTSGLYGQFSRLTQQRQNESALETLKQFGRQTLMSLLLAGGFGALFASFFIAIPKSLTHLLVPSQTHDESLKTVDTLSTEMLQTNSLGIIVDSLRMTLTGNLLGMRDAVVPAAVSFLLISGLGLLMGALGTEIFGFSSNFLFVVRDVFIIASTIAIACRWFVYRDNLREVCVKDDETGVVSRELATTQAVSILSNTSAEQRTLSQYGSFFMPSTLSDAKSGGRLMLTHGNK